MLWTLFVILLILYLLGLLNGVTLGGASHLVLIALVVIVIFAVRGRAD